MTNLFPQHLLSSLLLFLSTITMVNAQDVSVAITGINSSKGTISISVFKDSESFDQEKPARKFTFNKKALANGSMNVNCPLPPGTYGLTLIDDENENGQLERSLIGIPKEGFGFSNFFLTKMKKPSFNEFKFDVKDSPVHVEIKVKYM